MKVKRGKSFQKEVTWEGAIDVCSGMGIGFSDSMIINALRFSSFPFAVTLDADMAFAVWADKSLKDIVIPDGLIKGNKSLSKLL